jgi:hypothetical protein
MNETELRALVKDLQANVIKEQNRIKKDASRNTESFTMYPPASSIHKAGQIGLIVDLQFGVQDLISADLINPPNGLFWLAIKSFKEFENFIKNRGIPVYISFGGRLETKQDSYTCAKLFYDICKKAKLNELPPWECHSPVITKKEAIEMLLYGY